MRANTGTIKMRIDRLKHMLAECPSDIDASKKIQDILQKAPHMLQNAERTLQTGNPVLLEELGETLDRTEVLVTWATKTIKGQATAQAIKEGREADPSLEVDQRLLNRMLKFMLTLVDGPMYLQMVKEFAGDDVVEGNKDIHDHRLQDTYLELMQAPLTLEVPYVNGR